MPRALARASSALARPWMICHSLLRLAGRLGGLLDEQHVQVHGAGVRLVRLLVVLRRRQDVVGVQPGRVDAPVDRDDHLELRPQVLEQHGGRRRAGGAAGCRRPRSGSAARPRGAARRARSTSPWRSASWKYSSKVRFIVRVVVPGAVPDLAVAAVVVPEERRRRERCPSAGSSCARPRSAPSRRSSSGRRREHDLDHGVAHRARRPASSRGRPAA